MVRPDEIILVAHMDIQDSHEFEACEPHSELGYTRRDQTLEGTQADTYTGELPLSMRIGASSVMMETSNTVLTMLTCICIAISCLFLRALFRQLRGSPSLFPYPPGPRPFPLLGNVFNMPTTQEWKTFSRWGQVYGEFGRQPWLYASDLTITLQAKLHLLTSLAIRFSS